MLFVFSAAFAMSTGATPQPWPGSFDCGQCHNQTGNFLDLAPPEARPTIAVSLVGGASDGSIDQPLTLGEPRTVRVVLDSAFPDAGRSLGIGMAVTELDGGDSVVDRAGRLVSFDGLLQHTLLDNGDLTHTEPIPWNDGSITLDLELTPERPGDLMLYLVANDVDGDGEPSTGDYVWPQRFCFTVDASDAADRSGCDAVLTRLDPAEPLEESVETGCSTVPLGMGLWGLLFLPVLGWRR